jgi:hypothetical protein
MKPSSAAIAIAAPRDRRGFGPGKTGGGCCANAGGGGGHACGDVGASIAAAAAASSLLVSSVAGSLGAAGMNPPASVG